MATACSGEFLENLGPSPEKLTAALLLAINRVTPTMKQRSRVILFLAISQAACLVIGLWIQDRFVVTLAEWNEQFVVGATGPSSAAAIPTDYSESVDAEAATLQTPSDAALRSAMKSALPFSFLWIAVLQTIVAYLVLTRMHTEQSKKESRSQESTYAKAKELVRTRDAVVFGLAKLAESRDPDTGHHLERIALYSSRLATAMRRDRRYQDQVNPAFIRSIGISSALHDIGKVGVADAILLKPGTLTTEERATMQLHANIGGECIRRIERRLGNSNFLEMAREIAYCHHERWDGSGYPANLSGGRIPLAARIVSIADVYDALASKRAYKQAFPHEKCVDLIRQAAGKQFDPHLVEIFLTIEDQFRTISQRFREEPILDTDICRGPAFAAAADVLTAMPHEIESLVGHAAATTMLNSDGTIDDPPWPSQTDGCAAVNQCFERTAPVTDTWSCI